MGVPPTRPCPPAQPPACAAYQHRDCSHRRDAATGVHPARAGLAAHQAGPAHEEHGAKFTLQTWRFCAFGTEPELSFCAPSWAAHEEHGAKAAAKALEIDVSAVLSSASLVLAVVCHAVNQARIGQGAGKAAGGAPCQVPAARWTTCTCTARLTRMHPAPLPAPLPQLQIKRQPTQGQMPEASLASGTQDYVQAQDNWDLPTRLASVAGPTFRQACAAVAHSRRNLGERLGAAKSAWCGAARAPLMW